ncbi:GGDEF domain-containing protein [Rhizobium sp. NTR19]|uniref:GGDEF domain-containing protein n=1 Tax=Neorhizobium turbinariae TaxID=2937795 RepID=A0ABT0IX82_9HYPH|nr:GGDEF domain-containing protein [Neorhizobium turbinariae]MCK8782494.1 GGDEF domain-containing protein [Neorhizobium turbinariae]
MSLAEDELRKAAMTDPLTGLYNRNALTALVDRALGTSLSAGRRFGVLAIDMDGFKAINDRLGHHAGDTVLREASNRIRAALRAEDIALRMGGDEFAIFVPGVSSMQALIDVGERLLQSFRAPFEADGVLVSARICVGTALAPESARDRQELLKVVDTALYDAKPSGRDCLRVAGQPI